MASDMVERVIERALLNFVIDADEAAQHLTANQFIYNRSDLIAERIAAALSRPNVDERGLIVAYMRHMAKLRPADAHGLGVIASDIEARLHLDPELNPAALNGSGNHG